MSADALQYGALGLLALVLWVAGKFLLVLNQSFHSHFERIESSLVRLTAAIILAAKVNPDDVERFVPPPSPASHGGSVMRSFLLVILVVLALVLPGCSGWSGIGLPKIGCEIGGDGANANGGGPAADVACSRLQSAAPAPTFAPAAPAPAVPPIIIINARDGDAKRVDAHPAPPVASLEAPERSRAAPALTLPPTFDPGIVPLGAACTCHDPGSCSTP